MLSQSGKQAEVKALITGMELGKLGDIPQEKYLRITKGCRRVQ